MLSSREIRRQFIDYFVKEKGHVFVPSSPVVPYDDPTLLFTNAGMNQFKDVFLGTGKRDFTRAANTQKCIRAGGKHNDLEDVGRDTYHHTFFEMLGNWSFGDYFKAEAIAWAWELLTSRWGLPKDRLHATVFAGDPAEGLEPDLEAEGLWKEIAGIEPSRLSRWGKKDNFWEMGDTGPCGPCTEIHVDLTPDGSGAPLVNKGDPRVIEIWNLVFIQYNRDVSGRLHPLPARHVDTGMGFERVTAVLQGKSSNYDTDVFSPLFEGIREVTGARPYGGSLEDRVDTAYRVIADHVRCLTFALTDGAVPSSEGRGSVLRRILRRAVRHGWQTLGIEKPFLHRLVPVVVETMGEAFPELRKDPGQVEDLIREEEASFARTIDRGIAHFEAAVSKSSGKRLSGEDAFTLHDTFGFPFDLTRVMAQERGLEVDEEAFKARMAQAQEIARGAGGGTDVSAILVEIVQNEGLPATEFVGYDATRATLAEPGRLFVLREDGYDRADSAGVGARVAYAAGRTPFYAEAGGQVGDVGTIRAGDATIAVEDTQAVGGISFHLGTVSGDRPFPGATKQVVLEVDASRRARIMANHTATHVLNHKLRAVLGDHVQQKGSLVDEARTRFDFSHRSALGREEIERIESLVAKDVEAGLPVRADHAKQEDALKIHGLRAVFGEKYPPTVRVVSIGASLDELLADPGRKAWYDLSVEFCGGTHLPSTREIGRFAIVSEEAVAKGVRRVVGLTGEAAEAAHREGEALLAEVERLEKADPVRVADAIGAFLNRVQGATLPVVLRDRLQDGAERLKEKVKKLRKEEDREAAGRVVEDARRLAGEADGDLIVGRFEGADAKALRTAMDVIRQKRPSAALLLGSVDGDKIAFLASVPPALIERGLKAGDWVREVARVAGGGGGGKPDMAQAGGKDPTKVDEALATGRRYAESRI